jgi:hypothetical protein
MCFDEICLRAALWVVLVVLLWHALQAEVVADMSLKMTTLQRCPLFSDFDAPQLRRASLFFTLRRYPARTGTHWRGFFFVRSVSRSFSELC